MAEPGPSRALFADLYELTMAQAYWQHGHNASATFGLAFRTLPPDRGYAVFAGLEDALDHLEALRFTGADVDYLRSLGLFDPAFLDWLPSLRFTGDVRAMSEGDLVFAEEPVIEVTAPVIEAQLVETAVMNAIGLQTMLATKAARVMHAAQGRVVVEFAARRTQGEEAADRLARVSSMVGFAGTSNVLAAARYGISPVGTMAHSFISSFPTEAEAFDAYADSFPDTSTLLVDTYDTVEGVRRAAETGKRLREAGHALRAVRLDSGDLLALSIESRKILDDAGLADVQVFASGGLDEFDIEALLEAGAPIGGFGVGTRLGVSADAPWMDWAYKLAEYDGSPVLKLSEGKASLAGRKQVYRQTGADGMYAGDLLALEEERLPDGDGAPLLADVMRGGRRTGPSPTLQELRERFAAGFARLPEAYKALRSPELYPVHHSWALDETQWGAMQNTLARQHAPDTP
ncbi:MAG: nicotinate phosphoribosyltransferase [Chloroflexota bacterium]|nr:nicotinate phosphoribosyltransferase [Chloroflexota bacterium]MDE2883721.1 nicotinate phosphoribosyltransferase [Chloroflexota bacterium]